MKKYIKFLFVTISVVLLLFGFVFNNYYCFAFDFTGAYSTLENGKETGASNAAKSVMGSVVNVTRIIAAGIAVIILFALAIKYMMASPEGKADVKGSAITYFIGAFVLFSASGILTIINSVALD